MQRASLTQRWTRAAAAAGLGAMLAAGPATPGFAVAGAGAGTRGYAVTTIGVKGQFPWGCAVDPATGAVYVPTDYGDPSVSVIDESKNTVAHVMRFGTQAPMAVAVDAKTDTVFVALTNLPALDVVNGATDAVSATYGLPGAPVAVALNADASLLYVAYGNSVSAVDTATGSVTSTIGLGYLNHAMYLAMDPVTGTVYAAGINSSGTGTVWVLDASSLNLAKAIPVGTDLLGVAVNPVTNRAYVADGNAGVYVIDGGSYAITRIDTRWGANGVAVNAATNTIFAALGGQVAVIDGATGAVIMTVQAASNEWHGGIVADPKTGNVYASAYGDAGGYVSALTPGISPAITSKASATFTTGRPGAFTVTTSGSPAASVTESGRLPAGISLTPEPGTPGKAILRGTPSSGSGGTYPITLTASNGVNPGASQLFTLVVDHAPSINSARTAVFHHGVYSRFRITTVGFPVPALTEKGRLPRGFSFWASRNGTATISGKPTRSQRGRRFTVKIFARNSIGQVATQELTILIR
jgi:DNA-binding beta-propeller fold protein YncE